MELKAFTVPAKAMHELIVMPQFGDVLDDNGSVTIPSDEEGDWQIMDNVPHSRPIMDLFGGQNILKRRDATCKLIYSPAARLGVRYLYTDKLYAAVEDCQEEYYQGSFEDYQNQDFEAMFAQIMPIMEKGVATDLYSNKWFGDVSRFSDPNGLWSWNKFDGIFTQYAKYIASGVIPASQTFAIPAGTLTAAQANTALDTALAKQDGILKFMDKAQKVFYVDTDLAEAYYDYVKATGQLVIADVMSGRPILYKRGILIKPKKWDGILGALNSGTEAHAVILTVKGNFLFGTDSNYGGGRNRNQAIIIKYSEDDEVWRRQIHLKVGTEIAAPQHSVIGLTEF